VQTATAVGVQAPADLADERSPETYLGYRRETGFSSPGGVVADRSAAYTVPPMLDLNQWALGGDWRIDPDKAVLSGPSGRIVYGFSARDLHLVLGPAAADKPVRFRVLLDGAPPGANHGEDTDANGDGVIQDQRLYQLIRQTGAVGSHVFSIQFLDGGAQAYAFTFG
jgi:hypothetical protein